MTLSIKLTPAQKARLEAAAQKNGTEPQKFLQTLVEENLPPITDVSPAPSALPTLADTLAGRIGRLHSGGRRGEKSFADHLAEKHEAEQR